MIIFTLIWLKQYNHINFGNIGNYLSIIIYLSCKEKKITVFKILIFIVTVIMNHVWYIDIIIINNVNIVNIIALMKRYC